VRFSSAIPYPHYPISLTGQRYSSPTPYPGIRKQWIDRKPASFRRKPRLKG
jgi:hypothetical protein